MKLFYEKLIKYKYFILLVFSLVEFIGFIIIFTKYKSIYLKIFDQIKLVSIEKSINITNNINEIFRLSYIRYHLDLELIGKHMSFLANNKIDINTEFYENIVNNKDKHIIYGTVEELKKNLSEYYDETTNKFLFLEKYAEYYIENKTYQINILNDLMNNSLHPELNFISYYKINGNIDDIETNFRKKIAAKYLISILKTNFINRLLVKGNNFELLHYFLLLEDEIYIYPPEAYNNTLIYTLKDTYYCIGLFPKCFYNYLASIVNYFYDVLNLFGYMYPIFPFSLFYEENSYIIQCLPIPFIQQLNSSGDFSKDPKMCIELNMTQIFYKSFFPKKEFFHFIFFFPVGADFGIFFNDNFELFSDIKKVFNNSKFRNYFYHEENKYFYLFQFFYLDLFKEPSLLKEYGISLDDIFQEYEIIRNKILERIYSTKEDFFVIDIEKTACKSDIYYNGKKCIKDNYVIIVSPLSNDFNLLDANYVQYDFTINQALYYSMTIIDNNYKYYQWKINKIILIITLKLFIFFLYHQYV